MLVLAVGQILGWMCRVDYLCVVFPWVLASSGHGGFWVVGGWVAYRMAQSSQWADNPHEPGRSCSTSYDPASEVTGLLCHSPFTKAVILLPGSKGRGCRCHFLTSCRRSHLRGAYWGDMIVATLGNAAFYVLHSLRLGLRTVLWLALRMKSSHQFLRFILCTR